MRTLVVTAAALALAAPLLPPALAADAPPDLVAKLAVAPLRPGEPTLRVFADVVNAGGAAGPFLVLVHLDGAPIAEFRVASLAAGARAGLSAAIEHPEGGVVTVVADALDEVAEADESNNAASAVARFHDAGVAARLEPVPGSPHAQRVVATVCNTRGGTAEAARLHIGVTPRGGGAGSRSYGSLPVPPVAAGECVEVSRSLSRLAAGSFRVDVRLEDEWDLDRANARATVDGHALADPGVGVVVPGAGADV